ncbi:adenosine receptor A2b-like isoform X7 [Rhipicephalus microplus]|uniref:adenosine receptor A2b-like isoform X7 n=1 Tax=Rhipicephalus microplus TaxID=6941 RepID=UPI003F6C843B
MDLKNVTATSKEFAWDVTGELVEPNAWTSPVQVAIAALLVFLLSPVVLCSNALLLLSMYRFKRLRTPSNLFLVALFSADFGIGLLLPPGLYFEFSRPGIRCSALCLLPYCLLIQFSGVAMLSSAAVALDRCTSLALPLTYNNLITHRTAGRAVLTIWVYAILVSGTPLLTLPPLKSPCSFRLVSTPVRIFLLCAFYLPCLAVMTSSYVYVYVVARRHARAIYSVENNLRTTLPPDRHYGWTLTLTVASFAFLWTPVAAFVVLEATSQEQYDQKATFYLGLVGLGASSVDPLLYGFRNSEFRAALLRMLKELLPRMSGDFLGESPSALHRSRCGTASTLRPAGASTTLPPLETDCSACTRTLIMMDLRPVSYV